MYVSFIVFTVKIKRKFRLKLFHTQFYNARKRPRNVRQNVNINIIISFYLLNMEILAST
jgi:hypothetical protein